MQNRPHYSLLAKLAIRDLVFDRKVSFCIIASLMAVITPLLLLFSLKYGVVSQLRDKLVNDPSNLKVMINGNLSLEKKWFDWLKAQPEVQFAIPLTRSLNTIVDLRNDKQFVQNVELLPTDKGDPLLDFPLESNEQVAISSSIALKLSLKKGDDLTLIVTRNQQGREEKAMRTFNVFQIIPQERFITSNKFLIFSRLPVLLGVEDYRDGLKTDIFPKAEGKERLVSREIFARARIYAKSLDDVAPLAEKLEKQHHLSVDTKIKAINEIKAIDSVLAIIFAVIALTSIFGCILSLMGAFLSNIERKRKEIAVLRLLGFRQSAVGIYLICQAIVLSSVSFILSYILFNVGSISFNILLGEHLPQAHFVSRVHPVHLLFAFGLCFILSSLVATIGAIRAVKIQPAESLRDV